MSRLEEYINHVGKAEHEILTELADRVCKLLSDPELTYWAPQPGFDNGDTKVFWTAKDSVVPISCFYHRILHLDVCIGEPSEDLYPILRTDSGIEQFGYLLSDKLHEAGALDFDLDYVKKHDFTKVISCSEDESVLVLHLAHLWLHH